MNMLSIETLIEEVVEPQRDFGVEVEISKSGPSSAPALARNPAILYGLGNLVENAVDFAAFARPDRRLVDAQNS